MGFRNKIMKEHKNTVLCGYPVQFLLILENFCINRKVNFKKLSLYKPPLTPFWPCPAKQLGIFLSIHLRGKTNRQMLCIKGGRKGDKNWRKHVRARYWVGYTKGSCGWKGGTKKTEAELWSYSSMVEAWVKLVTNQSTTTRFWACLSLMPTLSTHLAQCKGRNLKLHKAFDLWFFD